MTTLPLALNLTLGNSWVCDNVSYSATAWLQPPFPIPLHRSEGESRRTRSEADLGKEVGRGKMFLILLLITLTYSVINWQYINCFSKSIFFFFLPVMVIGEWPPVIDTRVFFVLFSAPRPAEKEHWVPGRAPGGQPKSTHHNVKSPCFILKYVALFWNKAREAVGFQEVLDYSVEAPPEFCFSKYVLYLSSQLWIHCLCSFAAYL